MPTETYNQAAVHREEILCSVDVSKSALDYDRTIAKLDKGETIVTRIFTRFVVPTQIPLFDDLAREQNTPPDRLEYTG